MDAGARGIADTAQCPEHHWKLDNAEQCSVCGKVMVRPLGVPAPNAPGTRLSKGGQYRTARTDTRWRD